MNSLLIAVHTIRAVFFGSFLIVLLGRHLFFSRVEKQKGTSKKTLNRLGHFALIPVIISGIWMAIEHASNQSTTKLVVTILHSVIISGLLGVLYVVIKKRTHIRRSTI